MGHPAPPAPFRRVAGLSVGNWKVFVAPTGTATPGPFAAPWKVRGIWVAMVPTRPVFEQAVARQLGPNAVQWNDGLYVRSLVHEAFHAYLLSITRGGVPAPDGRLDESTAVRLITTLGDGEKRLAAEGAALAAAIEAPTLSKARAETTQFLKLREARRNATTDLSGIAAFEQQLEWVEGLPRYADLRLVLAAGEHPHAAIHGIHYPAPSAYRRAFLTQLADTKPAADGLRGRWQALGAAQAMLLDRLYAGWTEQALALRPLETLLRDAVRTPATLAGLRIATIQVGSTSLSVAVAETANQWRTGLQGVSSLTPLDGLLFVFPTDVSASFSMAGAQIPLDLTEFDKNGSLTATHEMPTCSAEPCAIYSPSRPYRYALETEHGTRPPLEPNSHLLLPRALRR